MTFLEKALTNAKIPFCRACPLAEFSTFRIGGKADLAVFPKTVEELICAVRVCRGAGIPIFIVGNGSNLLFSDSGVRGAVLFTKKINRVIEEPDGFSADCGAMLPILSRRAAARGLSGLEVACGIPGTVGGAVCMNAGAHGGEMARIVEKTEYYDPETDTCGNFSGNEHNFGYRTSRYLSEPGKIVLCAHIRLRAGDCDEIQKKMAENLAVRREKQPVGEPSAGSAFKRPKGFFAAELIDRCGLKGFSVGGAAVSEKHAGFIVNRGNATAKDVLKLMDLIRKIVFEKTGILLEPEIRILGEI